MTLTKAEVLEILVGISPQKHKPGPSRVWTSFFRVNSNTMEYAWILWLWSFTLPPFLWPSLTNLITQKPYTCSCFLFSVPFTSIKYKPFSNCKWKWESSSPIIPLWTEGLELRQSKGDWLLIQNLESGGGVLSMRNSSWCRKPAWGLDIP